MKNEFTRCVICGRGKEPAVNKETEEEVLFFYVNPNTNEQLCSSCNKTNDSIYKDKGLPHKGIFRVEKYIKEKEE